MVDVPVATPVTTPVAGSTEASVASLLLHVPLVVTVARVAVAPGQALFVPVIPCGTALTVTTTDVRQVGLSEYDTELVPVLIPVMTPVVEGPLVTVEPGALHVPPVLAVAKVVEEPTQNTKVPVIGAGVVTTVNGCVR
jgi:hypothetical protein